MGLTYKLRMAPSLHKLLTLNRLDPYKQPKYTMNPVESYNMHPDQTVPWINMIWVHIVCNIDHHKVNQQTIFVLHNSKRINP